MRPSPIRSPPPISYEELISPHTSIQAKLYEILSTHSLPHLTPRHWVTFSLSPSLSHSAPLSPSLSSSFRVMQFNLLAEGLSAHPNQHPPFDSYLGEGIDPSDCGGFDVEDERTALKIFNYNIRKWRLLEEILRVSPDVLAIEECDHYDDFFYPILSHLGYEGKYQPKYKSPSCGFGYYSDGVALFWRRELFEETVGPSQDTIDEQRLIDKKRSRFPLPPYLLVPLKNLATEKTFLFLATHLKAKSSLTFEELRANQISYLLEQIDVDIDRFERERERDGGRDGGKEGGRERGKLIEGVVVLGDFNADCYPVEKKEETIPPLAVQAVMTWRNSSLYSAYPLPTGHSPLYSTWKYRQGKESKHMIDYIFYSHSSLRVQSFLCAPEELERSSQKLPNLSYPSDHLSMAADLVII